MAEDKLEFDPRICELRQKNINQRISDVEKRLVQAIEQTSEVMRMSNEGRSKTLEDAIKTIQGKFEEIKKDLKLQEEKCTAGTETACQRCRQIVDACKKTESIRFESFERELEHLKNHIDTCAKEVKEKEIKNLGKRIDDLEKKKIKPLKDKCDTIDDFINKWKYIIIGVIIASGTFGSSVFNWLLKTLGV